MEDYMVRMQTLQTIREIAEGDLDLPQICVLSDQSSGKSALLSCLTGLDFPESLSPIVVQCRSSNSPHEIYEILCDSAKNSYSKCNDMDHLHKQISEIQEEAVNKLRAAAQATRGLALVSEVAKATCDAKTTEDDSAQEWEASEKIATISTEEICVRVSGPSQMDIIIIDLPGVPHNGDGADESRELIE
eukprot:3935797-Rhodomonas_salina.1